LLAHFSRPAQTTKVVISQCPLCFKILDAVHFCLLCNKDVCRDQAVFSCKDSMLAMFL
jgi:hypothetical protein